MFLFCFVTINIIIISIIIIIIIISVITILFLFFIIIIVIIYRLIAFFQTNLVPNPSTVSHSAPTCGPKWRPGERRSVWIFINKFYCFHDCVLEYFE